MPRDHRRPNPSISSTIGSVGDGNRDGSAALPSGPTEYHQFLRAPGYSWWKAILAIVLIPVAYVVCTFTLTWGLTFVSESFNLGLVPPETAGDGVVTMSPARLLASNLAIGLLIPVSLGLQRLLFGQSGRWLHSVHGCFRWKLALSLAGVLVPVWIAYGIVWTTLNREAAGVSGPPATLVSTLMLFVIALLTSPLQAAGEEYAARGLLARSFGSFASQPALALLLALLVPNLMFTVIHGLADPWLVVYTFTSGLACAVITWRTGGVEGAVVLHAVNNTILLLVASFFSSEVTIDRSSGHGEAMVPGIFLMVLTAAGVWIWARRRGISRSVDPFVGHPTSE
ncbi:CPBP family intramembrane glutamic endopeptidase [Streptomyces sp. STCH 565 A]|uniref:CPBP family intramembrane glutamic endopeptidase n=1 Tax=Streptomyces sp. STCH 565 A TaxID=2950532 RepID=UPI0020764073|nr:CPBP family intramembrane glutamic endopeptidase [Streptomyces sp. STCH 565 A]MCM8555421.1 CPBP family intramembrane metalloprotease [Streptomyces sp. STCH 565 A]